MIIDSVFESFARGRVGCAAPQYLAALAQIDFTSLRVFEFGWLINDMFEHDMQSFGDAGLEARENHVAGILRLPFESCVFTWLEKPDDMLDGTVEKVVFLKELPLDDGTMTFTVLSAINIRGGGRRGWILTPGAGQIYPEGYLDGVNTMTILHPENATPAMIFEIKDDITRMGGNIMSMAAMLARPGSVVEVGDTPTKDQNRLRTSRGFQPLPPLRRIVHLNKVIVHHPASATATQGSPKRPHDRRAHTRHLKSGKVITVASCQIKGGAGGFTIYDVVE
jgi:hypothetical protein